MSTIATTTTSLWERFENSDGRASRWSLEPRISLAYALSDFGARISRLGHRIHDEVPGDFVDGMQEGRTFATVHAGATGRIGREDAESMLSLYGVNDPASFLDRIGWPEDKA